MSVGDCQKLTRLPRREWFVRRDTPDSVVVGAFVDQLNQIHFKRYLRSDLPNDLLSTDDLERLPVQGCNLFAR